MQTVRHSQMAWQVTGCGQSSLIRHVRLYYTVAAPVYRRSKKYNAEFGGFAKRKPRAEYNAHTPGLDNLLGKQQMDESKETLLSLCKIESELKTLYGRERQMLNTIKGPLRVRLEATRHETLDRVSISMKNNKVIVDGKIVPNIWLRDNCQCSSCMHETTRQRLQDTFAIPKDLSVKSRQWNNPTPGEEGYLDIIWSDDHQSQYTESFLVRAVQSYEKRSITRQGLTDIHLWDASIASDPPIRFFRDEQGTSMILENIRKYGFCFIDKTPSDTPAETEELLRRIAFIRETHYGGFYDFTADLASADTAYTNIALEAHTDNTYFSDPAGLQAFHILSHTDGSGGESLFVDGFQVAASLRKLDKKAYKILSTVNVYAHASGNEGISIQPYRGFPVLEHDPATGDLLRIRWNSSDRAGIELPVERVEEWYNAARKFDALLKQKENEFWTLLTPGRVVVFDNWRVLHGRSAFEGKRRVCGGYVNRDDWISRYKMLNFGQKRVVDSLASS